MTNKDTTTTSGTADLRATFSEMLVDLPNTEPFTLFKAGFDAALAAGQATAAQQPGAAYAALPEPITYQIAVLKACEHGDALVGWRVEPSRQSFDASMRPKRKLYTEGDMHDFADRTHTLRASHGQAPATQQAGATKEHVRLVRVIADKIEDGTLFRSGIYSNKDLARFVRNVADAAAPQFPTTQAQADSVLEDAARYRWLAAHCRSTSEHWGGRWSIVVEGPAPKSHNSEDDFDAAIDAARKQGENHD